MASPCPSPPTADEEEMAAAMRGHDQGPEREDSKSSDMTPWGQEEGSESESEAEAGKTEERIWEAGLGTAVAEEEEVYAEEDTHSKETEERDGEDDGLDGGDVSQLAPVGREESSGGLLSEAGYALPEHQHGLEPDGSATTGSDSGLWERNQPVNGRLASICARGHDCTEISCPFAHSEEELAQAGSTPVARISPKALSAMLRSSYKTQLCRFFERNRCRNGARCIYAHGPGELRQSGSATIEISSSEALMGVLVHMVQSVRATAVDDGSVLLRDLESAYLVSFGESISAALTRFEGGEHSSLKTFLASVPDMQISQETPAKVRIVGTVLHSRLAPRGVSPNRGPTSANTALRLLRQLLSNQQHPITTNELETVVQQAHKCSLGEFLAAVYGGVEGVPRQDPTVVVANDMWHVRAQNVNALKQRLKRILQGCTQPLTSDELERAYAEQWGCDETPTQCLERLGTPAPLSELFLRDPTVRTWSTGSEMSLFALIAQGQAATASGTAWQPQVAAPSPASAPADSPATSAQLPPFDVTAHSTLAKATSPSAAAPPPPTGSPPRSTMLDTIAGQLDAVCRSLEERRGPTVYGRISHANLFSQYAKQHEKISIALENAGFSDRPLAFLKTRQDIFGGRVEGVDSDGSSTQGSGVGPPRAPAFPREPILSLDTIAQQFDEACRALELKHRGQYLETVHVCHKFLQLHGEPAQTALANAGWRGSPHAFLRTRRETFGGRVRNVFPPPKRKVAGAAPSVPALLARLQAIVAEHGTGISGPELGKQFLQQYNETPTSALQRLGDSRPMTKALVDDTAVTMMGNKLFYTTPTNLLNPTARADIAARIRAICHEANGPISLVKLGELYVKAHTTSIRSDLTKADIPSTVTVDAFLREQGGFKIVGGAVLLSSTQATGEATSMEEIIERVRNILRDAEQRLLTTGSLAGQYKERYGPTSLSDALAAAAGAPSVRLTDELNKIPGVHLANDCVTYVESQPAVDEPQPLTIVSRDFQPASTEPVAASVGGAAFPTSSEHGYSIEGRPNPAKSPGARTPATGEESLPPSVSNLQVQANRAVAEESSHRDVDDARSLLGDIPRLLDEEDYIFRVIQILDDAAASMVLETDPTCKLKAFDVYYCVEHMRVHEEKFRRAGGHHAHAFHDLTEGMTTLRNNFFHERGTGAHSFLDIFKEARHFVSSVDNAKWNLEECAEQYKAQFSERAPHDSNSSLQPESRSVWVLQRQSRDETNASGNVVWNLEEFYYPWERTEHDYIRRMLQTANKVLMHVMDRAGIDRPVDKHLPADGDQTARDVQQNIKHIRKYHAREFAATLGWTVEELTTTLASIVNLRNTLSHHRPSGSERRDLYQLVAQCSSLAWAAKCPGQLRLEAQVWQEQLVRHLSMGEGRREARQTLWRHILRLSQALLPEVEAAVQEVNAVQAELTSAKRELGKMRKQLHKLVARCAVLGSDYEEALEVNDGRKIKQLAVKLKQRKKDSKTLGDKRRSLVKATEQQLPTQLKQKSDRAAKAWGQLLELVYILWPDRTKPQPPSAALPSEDDFGNLKDELYSETGRERSADDGTIHFFFPPHDAKAILLAAMKPGAAHEGQPPVVTRALMHELAIYGRYQESLLEKLCNLVRVESLKNNTLQLLSEELSRTEDETVGRRKLCDAGFTVNNSTVLQMFDKCIEQRKDQDDLDGLGGLFGDAEDEDDSSQSGSGEAKHSMGGEARGGEAYPSAESENKDDDENEDDGGGKLDEHVDTDSSNAERELDDDAESEVLDTADGELVGFGAEDTGSEFGEDDDETEDDNSDAV